MLVNEEPTKHTVDGIPARASRTLRRVPLVSLALSKGQAKPSTWYASDEVSEKLHRVQLTRASQMLLHIFTGRILLTADPHPSLEFWIVFRAQT